jgi:hypothetical protein
VPTIQKFIILFFSIAIIKAQSTAPLEVVNSAIAAANDLGKEVVLGKHKVAFERMYPQWKERLISRLGGEEQLEQQLAKTTDQMREQGISMISFKTYGFPKVHEVYPGKKVETKNGRQTESLISTKWLIFIPTETRYRIQAQSESIVMETKGFQIAIADKKELKWTFIDGSDVAIQDLRSLFISLPADLELPETKRRTIPKNEE